MKIIYNNPSQSATKIRDEAGYIMLNADLNKGAGGAYIYFAFSRDVQQVLSGPEYYQNQPYSSPFDILRGFQTKNGGRFSIPSANTAFFDIWTYYNGYTQADLNGGAGGEYIYSYQSKNPGYSNNAEVSEVGVLSGNSDTIQPPAGWVKWNKDLNGGCGGDYIYFCYKY
ncbi:MAG: hypothetical protein EOO60_04195 [Hymenobacter sp.]|nr:MAG: hypothetical protein EOO60_04195 [Hymenobacter sp.]